MTTSEAQLKAIAKYRSKNKERVREITRLSSRKYYSDPIKYQKHKDKLRQKYQEKKSNKHNTINDLL